MSNRIAGLNQLVKNKGAAFKAALLRPQRPEAQYHMLGFEIFLETIASAFDHPMLFEPDMSTELVNQLNEMIRETTSNDLLIKYYEHLMKKVE